MLGLNGLVNVSRSSICAPDWSNVDNSVILKSFLHAELSQRCQLTFVRCGWNRVKARGRHNDKFFLKFILKVLQFAWSFLSFVFTFLPSAWALFLISLSIFELLSLAFYVAAGVLRGVGVLQQLGQLCSVLFLNIKSALSLAASASSSSAFYAAGILRRRFMSFIKLKISPSIFDVPLSRVASALGRRRFTWRWRFTSLLKISRSRFEQLCSALSLNVKSASLSSSSSSLAAPAAAAASASFEMNPNDYNDKCAALHGRVIVLGVLHVLGVLRVLGILRV